MDKPSCWPKIMEKTLLLGATGPHSSQSGFAKYIPTGILQNHLYLERIFDVTIILSHSVIILFMLFMMRMYIILLIVYQER